MNSLARRVIAAEAETDIRHAAGNFGVGQVFFNPARGVDKVYGVIIVFFNAGGDCKNIRVKDDIFGRKIQIINQ